MEYVAVRGATILLCRGPRRKVMMTGDRRLRIVAVVGIVSAVVLAVAATQMGVRLRRPANPVQPQQPGPEVNVSDLAGGNERDMRILGEFDLARLFPKLVLRQGDVSRKIVALTFDDGPDTVYTPKILDILASKGVPATFFLIGKRLSEAPDIVRRIVAEGHSVGNHTFNHPNMTTYSQDDLNKEVLQTDAALSRLGVKKTDMFRPPYGGIQAGSIETIGKAGYRLYLWSVDSLDWRGLNRQQVLDNVVPYSTNGAVILMHSAGGPGENLSGTVEALPIIIDQLKANGFRFVTLTEMFPPGGS